jgi:ATP-binding cassette, subfamily C, bacterial exporter for protease/lipase
MARLDSRRPENELSEAVGSFRSVFFSVGAFSCAINVLLLAPALYMLQIYDRVLASRNETTLVMLTVIMVGLLLLASMLEFVRSRVAVRASAALDMRLSGRVFDATFGRSLTGRGGNAGQAFSDLTTIRQFLTGKGLFAFFDAPWTPIYIFVIFLLHPWLGAFALGAAVILFVLAVVNEWATGSLLADAGRQSAAANHYAASNLRNAEAIEAMGMLPSLRQRWFERQSRFLVMQGEASDRAARVGSVTRFFRLALQSGILGFGAFLVLYNELSPGGMIAASILLVRALSPVDLAIATWRGVVAARASYGRLKELLAAFPPRSERVTLPRPQGRIAVDRLIAAAPGTRQPILKGLSFKAEPGTLVAVIGPSASGKSTLARVLVGVWPPLDGTVRLDGADVHTWDKPQLGQWIGYLPQDVELFEGTIGENIARFGPVDAAVVQAAQRAGVHEMILQLPQGYETPIGEGGMALSAGQRQRIALARALYGEPALIVLDEPNANLDDAGDAALIAALQTLREEKRTVFVMTHRVNVLRVADVVLVLAGGRARAFGARDEVLKSLPRRPRPSIQGPAPDGEASEEAL